LAQVDLQKKWSHCKMAVGNTAEPCGNTPTAKAGCGCLPCWRCCRDSSFLPDVRDCQDSGSDCEGEGIQTLGAVELLRLPSIDGISTESASSSSTTCVGFRPLTKRYGVALPETTRIFRCQLLTSLIENFPEVRRVVKGFGVPSVIVGGAVRDLLSVRKTKDVDLNIALTKEEILAAAEKFTDPEDIKVGPLAVTIGPATANADAIDCLPFAQMSYDPEYAENDVNSLMYDPTLKLIIDPFGTGMEGVSTRTFRIPTNDFEAWYRFKIPGRANNGKVPRVFKMLQHGFRFGDRSQQAEFNRLCDRKFRDLVEIVIAGKFSTLATVLLMNVRGDSFDFKTGRITKSKNALKLEKFDMLLQAMEELNPAFHRRVTEYLATVEESGLCPSYRGTVLSL